MTIDRFFSTGAVNERLNQTWEKAHFATWELCLTSKILGQIEQNPLFLVHFNLIVGHFLDRNGQKNWPTDCKMAMKSFALLFIRL